MKAGLSEQGIEDEEGAGVRPRPAPPQPAHAVIIAGLAVLKLVTSLVTLGLGFRAVSDDDFARVVIAQDFARSPKLDPSGTSWLPLPFWLEGTAMLVFGRSLDVATVLAVVAGILSIVATYVSGLWMTRDRTTAALGAAIAAVLPWSARLGVSTVPELPTAALTLLAMASVVRSQGAAEDTTDRSTRILIGALSLFAATLSRYEPWFIAVGFAAFVLHDAFRPWPSAAPRRRERAVSVVAALIALMGPALWMAWNDRVHGAPLHFLDRVAAYREAIDHGSLLSHASSYLLAIARAEPEVLAIVLAALVHLHVRVRRHARRRLSPFVRPFVLGGWLVATLTLSSLRGGAPTHHPERALFVVFLLLSILLAHLAVTFFRDRASAPSTREMAVLAVVIACLGFPVRRWVLQSESYANRDAEIEVGRAYGRSTAPGEKALLGVSDYGYFAVQAASGRPEDITPDHAIDPAHPVATLSAIELVDRARLDGYAHVIGRRSSLLPSETRVRFDDGTFLILDLDPPSR